jgi:hypothetical protein
MATVASNPDMAVQFLSQLDTELRARAPEIELWERYYEGVHRLAFATSRFRQTFGNLFHEFSDNWMELIVDASVERLNIQGFRFGDGTDDSDLDAWDMFRDNGLDSDSDIAHTEAVKLGKAYLIVDPHDKTDLGNPTISVEHPSQTIIANVAGNRKRRKAALKEWTDHTGYVYANVYFPDGTYRFQTDSKVNAKYADKSSLGIYGDIFPNDYLGPPAVGLVNKDSKWIPRQDGEPFFVAHDLGVVPVIALENNPSLKVGGRSDIAPIIPIQDGLNKLVMDMIIASEFASFGQRWATGLEIPKDPETGEPISDSRFLAAVSRVWAVEDPDVKFGQFAASDLGNYVKAIEMLIQHVAAITRTPPHYLLGQSGAFPSGDSLAATETGLVAKVKRKMTNFSAGWEEAMRLAFKAKGDARGDKPAETVWADPEQRIRAARIDGALKMAVVGVPQDAIWEEMGASPHQILRWHAMRKAMGLPEYGSDFAPIPPPPAPLAPVGPDGKPVPGAKPPAGGAPPVNLGPDGNLPTEQAITQTERITKIHD